MRRSAAGTVALLIAIAAASCVPTATTEPAPRRSPPGRLARDRPPPSLQRPCLSTGRSRRVAGDAGAQVVDAQPVDPGHIARWMVDAIGPDVYAFYLDALPAAGYVIEERFGRQRGDHPLLDARRHQSRPDAGRRGRWGPHAHRPAAAGRALTGACYPLRHNRRATGERQGALRVRRAADPRT